MPWQIPEPPISSVSTAPWVGSHLLGAVGGGLRATPLIQGEGMNVSVLFARRDSVYKTIPGCDVWDEDRDARFFKSDTPVIAHPPCRAWGQLRMLAKPQPHEKELARLAVRKVRSNGGVLEHPRTSTLWDDMRMSPNLTPDEHGGITVHVDQFWWGHKARKSTKLYICGLEPKDFPLMPLKLGEPEYVVDTSRGAGPRKFISKAEREATPIEFALWLVDLANRCRVQS